jgi:hypothetical protein
MERKCRHNVSKGCEYPAVNRAWSETLDGFTQCHRDRKGVVLTAEDSKIELFVERSGSWNQFIRSFPITFLHCYDEIACEVPLGVHFVPLPRCSSDQDSAAIHARPLWATSRAPPPACRGKASGKVPLLDGFRVSQIAGSATLVWSMINLDD